MTLEDFVSPETKLDIRTTNAEYGFRPCLSGINSFGSARAGANQLPNRASQTIQVIHN